MIDKLLDKAKIEIANQIDKLGYIDDSDNMDRFLDDMSFCIAQDEILKGNEDVDFFNETMQDVNDLSGELIMRVLTFMDATYKKKGHKDCCSNYRGCYYKEEKDYMAWIKYWQILRGIA